MFLSENVFDKPYVFNLSPKKYHNDIRIQAVKSLYFMGGQFSSHYLPFPALDIKSIGRLDEDGYDTLVIINEHTGHWSLYMIKEQEIPELGEYDEGRIDDFLKELNYDIEKDEDGLWQMSDKQHIQRKYGQA